MRLAIKTRGRISYIIMNCSLQEHKKEGCKDYENKCDKDDEKTINIKKMTLKQALAVAVRREKQDRT
jgi:hypothetical protein